MSTENTTTPEPTTRPSAPESILAVLQETRSELARAREELQSTARGLAIDRALMEAGATNLAAARAKLAEDAGADPAAAVAALREHEPALFATRARVNPGLSTSTPRSGQEGAVAQVRSAAGRAATGDRRALLEYMRLRRAVV